MEVFSRREFLTDGALLAGSTLGALAWGGNALAPGTVLAGQGDFIETQCGRGANNGQKVLVAYTSFCGSTGGVAAAIGQVLCDAGAAVDVRQAKDIADLRPYKAVVIGSAVRSASWWPEAIDFVDGHQAALRHLPVAYFLTCLALYKETPGSRKVARGYLNPVLKAVPDVKPLGMGLFAGALDYGRLNFIYRAVMKSKMKKQGVPEGDFRNWDAIKAWAAGLAGPLLGA